MIAPVPERDAPLATLAVDALQPAPHAIARVPRKLAIEHRVLPIELLFVDGEEVVVLASPQAQRFSDAQSAIRRRRVEARRVVTAEDRVAGREGDVPARNGRLAEFNQRLAATSARDRQAEDAIIALRASAQCDRFEFVHVEAAGLQSLTHRVYGVEPPPDPDVLVNLVNELLRDAVYRRFTDLEIVPRKHGGVVHGLVDDTWVDLLKIDDTDEYVRIVTIIKSRAAGPSLQPGTANVPQDGHFTIKLPHRSVDVRVNIMPMHKRETAWLRLHDLDMEVASPERLGMPKDIIDALDEAFLQAELEEVNDHQLFQDRGCIWIVGPQRVGKTTTFEGYMVHRLLPRGKRCAGVYNPIERVIHEIAQFEVNERGGMSFEDILRALKRRRYFFTFIAEGRDKASVQAAFSSTSTGGITGQTAHAVDSIGLFEKLTTEFDIAVTKVIEHTKLVLAQRLVRRLCNDCKEPSPAPPVLVKFRASAANAIVFRPVGCDICNHTGYRRELGVFEKLRPTRKFWEAFAAGAIADTLYEVAVAEGYRPMFEHAIDRVLAGETSVEEIFDKVPKVR